MGNFPIPHNKHKIYKYTKGDNKLHEDIAANKTEIKMSLKNLSTIIPLENEL